MRTVVTGGCGFIGAAVVRGLVRAADEGDEIIVVDNLQRHGTADRLAEPIDAKRVTFVNGDLLRGETLARIPSPVDRLYHLAAVVGVGPVERDPVSVLKTNTLSTLAVAEWFLANRTDTGRFLFSSSSEVYAGTSMAGFELPIPTPETVPVVITDIAHPRFTYALSKAWGESLMASLARSRGVPMVSVRYHNIYGPEMGYDHVVPQIVMRALRRESPFRIIGADQTRSFCFVADGAEATRLVMEAADARPGELVHIGDERGEIAIGTLYEMIFDVLGERPEAIESIAAPNGSVARRCPDTSRLFELTGYRAATPLAEGLAETVAWYRSHPQ